MLRKTSLSTKITLILGSTVLIGLIIMSSLELLSIHKSSYNDAMELAQEVSKGYANEIMGDFEVAEASVNGILNTLKFAKQNNSMTREDVIKLLETTLDATPSILGIYTCWEPDAFDGKDSEYINKDGHDSTGRLIPYLVRNDGKITLTALTDYTIEGTGNYYLIPTKTKKPALIEPYYYKVNGKDVLLTSLVVPILDDVGNAIGIVGADITLTAINDIVNNAKPMGGYAAVFTNKGTIVAIGLSPELITKNIGDIEEDGKDVITKISNAENFFVNSKSVATGLNSVKVFAPINVDGIDTHWSFASIISDSQIYAKFNQLLINILIIIGIILPFILIIMFFAIKINIKPITIVSNHLQTMANADFTQNFPDKYVKRQDEVGILAKSLKTMQESINLIINGVKNEASNVDMSISSAESYMSELNSEIEDVSATTEQLAAGMEETASSAQEMNATSEELVSAVEAVASRASEGSNAAKIISQRAQELKTSTIVKRQNANEVYSMTQDKLKTAIEKSKNVEKINTLLQAILSIASQTNLLALNAAIEAARAGESGKGFSVVADEIRKLAEESKNTANEIQQITKDVILSVGNLSESSTKILEFVDKQVIKDYENMVQTSEQYNDDSMYVDSLVTEFSAAAEELLASIQEITTAVTGVANAANDGAAGTTNIAEKTTTISQKASEVLKQAKHAKDSSNNLINMVSKFKVKSAN